jgi:diacylglycerol O-acyltransferase
MSPTDATFLTIESREHPMHVGGLQLFQPPPGGDANDALDMFRAMIDHNEVAPFFRRRARRSLTTAGQWVWEQDEQFDIEHHVRYNALPRPGRVLELLALCSRLHSTLLDRHRPLWEVHLIEGLADGRFAMYFKIHHAMIDGVAAQRMLQSVLTRDPDLRGMAPPWAPMTPAPRPVAEVAEERRPPSLLELPTSAVRSALGVAADAAGIPRALMSTINRGVRDQATAVSFSAPKSMFNVPITGSRRFAAQSWPLDRIRQVRKATGATLNDVVLAMSSGALRSYMQSLDALPDSPLIAMVPVALRGKDRSRTSGNAVGAVMCNLGTHLADPADRLETVKQSMIDGKAALSTMTPLQILTMTAIGMSPLVLQPLFRMQRVFRPPFNLIISNVPGPRVPLYLNGWRMDGLWPLSVPLDGQALNITCTSYVDELGFGLTGCRRSVPHLQRLLGHLDDELSNLEKAAGVA